MTRSIVGVLAIYLSGLLTARMIDQTANQTSGEAHMRLGNFSVSLAVKDIGASRTFYETLGFRVMAGGDA